MFGATSSGSETGVVHVGRVTRVRGARCYVELAQVAPGFEYGPCRYPAGATLVAGDVVAAAFLAGGADDVVVLVHLT